MSCMRYSVVLTVELSCTAFLYRPLALISTPELSPLLILLPLFRVAELSRLNNRKEKTHLSTCFETVHIPAMTGVTVRIADMACNVKKHINSNKHKRPCNRQQNLSKVQQESPSQLLERTFYEDICDAFIASNIPLNKLENTKLRGFSEKYTGRQIPKEATLRKKYVQHAYEKCLREMKCKLQNEKIWVSFYR
ncbi:hypothetical protein ANN_17191 [Periplaneta americana]|uniref:Uncharacterized protein n=1 Tax=Periplaneta americana TaxID=6978 RepID=A0ABQ8STJ0_PERAM|nr:hypothetical protein ANN_17191 [Periplaneta americana]